MSGARTALVLIDLQHWIVGMPWAPTGGSAVVAACAALRESFAAADPESVVLVRYLRADGRDGGAGAPANQLVPALAPRPGEHLVTKHGLDAFEGTDLHARLQGLGVTRVVVAGLSTAHGVAATAARAVALGYETVVAEDATASQSAAEHRHALARLAGLGVLTGPVEHAAP
ncbi:cysteine hydrolase family protein [Kitasatospora sp. NPDC092948]|uniref:cysteine hydrolase family protein n=1 Tax=Kitasatospora sp. NPDC092948 TaxID=3364088 RepID=UPI003804FFB5